MHRIVGLLFTGIPSSRLARQLHEECGWDGGDCTVEGFPDCHVDYPESVGNGRCDGGEYNTEECGWDGGDCDLYNSFPDCHVEFPSYVGNGICNDGDDYDGSFYML